MRAEIISIGTELLLGEITDTNASFLASQLPLLGIDLYWISQVGDNQTRLVEVLKRAWQRSELILTSGGLGPTEDDLTRESIAEMLGEKLEIESSSESGLRERFAQWGVEMPISNLRQATIIPSAELIRNEQGTAPGWWVERDDRILIAMPGPPTELQGIWQKEVQSRLRQGSESIILSKTFKIVGLSEAAVGELVSPLLSSANPTLAVYAKSEGIQLRLTAKAKNQEQASKMIAEGEAGVKAILSKYIWGTDNDTLGTVVGCLLVEKGLSLAIVEDYSGGWLTAPITDNPKSPAFFKGGLVAHSDKAKVVFGVSDETISKYGAVSPEVAQAMAEGVRALLGADIGVGISGIEEQEAGPTGVVYYIAVVDGSVSKVISRTRLSKQRAATTALFELRKLLVSID
ncbi:competence/damage-inducible protein A [Chloroflexota bacterium]